ncbi:MAG: hypothetical protein L6E13_07860 [Firmicutes bacterium]|nr:hypothetical protein [Bacillota bacterium]
MTGGVVLALDGGGTKCRAVLVDPRAGVVGRGRAGACNPHSVGDERALAALREAIAGACAGGVPGGRLERVVCGLAGVDTPAGAARGEALVRQALGDLGLSAGEVLVENDALVVLRGLAPGGEGLIAVAGTGSVVYARHQGRTVRVGGWGHRVGDEGSGLAIAQAALAAVYRAWDGYGEETALVAALCRAVGAADPVALQEWLYRPETGLEDIAGLAPVVAEVAAAGDAVAGAILAEAGARLATLAATAARRSGLAGVPGFPALATGGVLRHSRPVQEAFFKKLKELCPAARPEVLAEEPVLGAALLALGGIEKVPPELVQRLREQLA